MITLSPMAQSDLFEKLKNPAIYGPNVHSIETIQTHISLVLLTGTYAYKIKKPVNFGFLDFSTLEKRKHFCEEEIRLNKRLCPDIYLEVLPITEKNNNISLNGSGKIIEYALKMKEFSQDNIMTNKLQSGQIHEETIDKICSKLVDFYAKGPQTEEINTYGKTEIIQQNIDENFEQTQEVIGTTIDKKVFDTIQNASNNLLSTKKDCFDKRIKKGYIKDCHGDLHSGNIVISDKIYIFDCIEFNKRFRYGDIASDIGFLAMDLDYLNHPYLSSYLIDKYIELSKDQDLFTVLNFYKSYRAYVRGKVIGFKLTDPHINKSEQENTRNIAKKYFELSHYYAALFSLDLQKKRPLLFLVSGLSGTGKSTLSLKLSIDYHAQQINSDIVRKEIAGIDKFEKHLDDINTGLYDPKTTERTYDKIMEKATHHLQKNQNVIIDATLQKEKYRNIAKQIADDTNAILITLQCICPDAIVKQWLEERMTKKTVSDGRWEIYLHQKKTFEPFHSKKNHLEIDMSKQTYTKRMEYFWNILKTVQEA